MDHQYNDAELLSFEQFCDEVGAKPYSVRKALADMGRKALPLFSDRRRTGYPHDWVQEVKSWLINHIYE